MHCVKADNYIHVDYIKKKYPEIDVHALKIEALRDGYTLSDTPHAVLSALFPKYPKVISHGSCVTFGVPYYVFIPSIFLTYLIAKKYS